MRHFHCLLFVVILVNLLCVIGCGTCSFPTSNSSSGSPGAGSVPVVSLSPGSVTFSSTAVGATPAVQSISLYNTGNEALSLSGTGLGISITGANADSYSQTNQCGARVAVGASCSIAVTFRPISAGSLSATMSVAYGMDRAPLTVPLSGTAIQPQASLSSPGSLIFSNTPVGATPATQSISLYNTGSEALSLSGTGLGFSITGTNADSFSQTNQCGASVAAGANCSITVTFSPTSIGLLGATMSVAYSLNGSPLTVPLSGTGIQQSAGPTSGSGNVYYVDNSIPDINPASATPDCTNYNPATFLCGGGSANAYATIADINSMILRPGDQVLFRRGEIWREQVTDPPGSHGYSGSAENPITFGSYGTPTSPLPIISGANLFVDWTPVEVSSNGSTITVYSSAYSITSNFKYYTDYNQTPYTDTPQQVFEDGSRLTQNTSSYATLTAGQWYLDETNSLIWVRLTGDDAPEMHTMEASQRDFGIEIFSHSYVNIRDLQATDANVTGINYGGGADDNGVISGVVASYNFVWGIGIVSSTDNTITASTVAFNGGGG
ncbi:MAG: choice-of-anchor D domain-containing protein, partial [Terracidiphilus sp.]